MSTPTRQYDGAHPVEQPVRRVTRSPPLADEVCVIYVHAGAGYHSLQNERIHLEACNDAAAIGMCIMKNGGSAVDAVEAAIKLLEDREITNAGFGSNLAMDGVVECDASIVDHFGRSGAVGAVAQIKNPISLARMVYEHTSKPLTLRRVPPNLLCAQGATEFAAELGIPILPHDMLVSPAAKERWLRWRADLQNAERKARKTNQHPSCYRLRVDVTPADELEQSRIRQKYTNDLLQECHFLPASSSREPSDDSLYHSTENASSIMSETITPSGLSSSSCVGNELVSVPDAPIESLVYDAFGPSSVAESSRSALINSTQKVPTLGQLSAAKTSPSTHTIEDDDMQDMPNPFASGPTGRKLWGDGSSEACGSAANSATANVLEPTRSAAKSIGNDRLDVLPEQHASIRTEHTKHMKRPALDGFLPVKPTSNSAQSETDKPDHITDTVGAIAIDSWGRIACGASSGGIGMKYRGRVGPAALVGVGAAVVPLDPDDSEQVSVATVTSGTGEHMATTMAATTCAERIYQSVKKQRGGEYAEVTEDEALRSTIENEFMGHPSVKHSNSAGAIGILGVKKTRFGIMLFYGHNTDSFALASMSSDDDVPKCTMSRSGGNGQIAQGGRIMSYKTRKRAKTMPRQRQVG